MLIILAFSSGSVPDGILFRLEKKEGASSGRSGIVWDGAMLLLVACSAAVVFSARQFPSQDGPVHLYYVDIIRGLLMHSGPYAQNFALKSFLTPYTLEYFLLFVLELLFSPAMSEKLLLCGYIAAFVLGFRFLLGSVGETRSPWTLVAIPFCLNLPVYLGFMNYCAGVTLALFLSGFWIRHHGRLTLRHTAVMMAGLALLLLTHPAPVMVFLLFAGLHSLVNLSQKGLVPYLHDQWRPVALMAAMGAAAFLWIGQFVDRSLHNSAPNYVARFGWANTLGMALSVRGLMPFVSYFYAAGPMLLLVVAVATLCGNRWRADGRLRSSAVALLLASGACFLLYCLTPSQLNGSFYVPERFPIFSVTFLIAAAAALRPPRWWGRAAGSIAIVVTCLVLTQQWKFIRNATEISPALEAAPAKPGSVGIIVGADSDEPEGLAFNPFMWAGAHYFRRSNAILANTPWMDIAIIMIRPTQRDRWNYLDPDTAGLQLGALGRGGEDIPELDFVLANPPDSSATERLLGERGLTSSAEHDGKLRIYSRRR